MGLGKVIVAPQERFAQGRRKGPQPVAPRRVLRRDFVEDAQVTEGEGGYNRGRKRAGLRLTFRGGLPETMVGRIVAGVTGLAILGGATAGAIATKRLMLRDQRFVIPGVAAIETVGNQHLERPELLRVLGGDVGRNVFSLSLEQQRAELEQIPWVERATVMRVLPDRLRASVTERMPIAFVREKAQIGLVDANGVLLDLRQGGSGSYSFPVVTGVLAKDPPSERAERMKIYSGFIAALDATGEHISAKLSEVDLSNPEDVKALIPDSGAEVLVHFGDTDYLERYRKYEAHLGSWRQQYPKLASVDMRYDRQAVLEMQPGTDVPVNNSVPAVAASPKLLKPGHELLKHGPARATSPVHVTAGTAPRTAPVPLDAGSASTKERGPRFGGAVKHLTAKVVHR